MLVSGTGLAVTYQMTKEKKQTEGSVGREREEGGRVKLLCALETFMRACVRVL